MCIRDRYEDAWKGALLESPFRKEFEAELGLSLIHILQ